MYSTDIRWRDKDYINIIMLENSEQALASSKRENINRIYNKDNAKAERTLSLINFSWNISKDWQEELWQNI